jgi:DNA-binding CsgD family transcriptional regulator
VAQCDMARKIALVLTRRELDCLHLRAEGLGYTQIAASIGIRPGTVGTLLTRARAKAHHFAKLQTKSTETAGESAKRSARMRPPIRLKSR